MVEESNMKPTFSPDLSSWVQQEITCQEWHTLAAEKKLKAFVKRVSKYTTWISLDSKLSGADDIDGIQSEAVGLGVQIGAEAALTDQKVYSFDFNNDDSLVTVYVLAKSMKDVRAKVKAALRKADG